MFKFKQICNVILLVVVCVISAEISDKRLCANPDCTEPISTATTIRRYGSDDPKILSFKENMKVTIYSKSAGKKKSLWGAEINGKRGYVPISHIREQKIFTNKLNFEVDTEENLESSMNKEKLSPDPVKKPYDIIDGTTIYTNTVDSALDSALDSAASLVSETTQVGRDDLSNMKDTENRNYKENLKGDDKRNEVTSSNENPNVSTISKKDENSDNDEDDIEIVIDTEDDNMAFVDTDFKSEESEVIRARLNTDKLQNFEVPENNLVDKLSTANSVEPKLTLSVSTKTESEVSKEETVKDDDVLKKQEPSNTESEKVSVVSAQEGNDQNNLPAVTASEQDTLIIETDIVNGDLNRDDKVQFDVGSETGNLPEKQVEIFDNSVLGKKVAQDDILQNTLKPSTSSESPNEEHTQNFSQDTGGQPDESKQDSLNSVLKDKLTDSDALLLPKKHVENLDKSLFDKPMPKEDVFLNTNYETPENTNEQYTHNSSEDSLMLDSSNLEYSDHKGDSAGSDTALPYYLSLQHNHDAEKPLSMQQQIHHSGGLLSNMLPTSSENVKVSNVDNEINDPNIYQNHLTAHEHSKTTSDESTIQNMLVNKNEGVEVSEDKILDTSNVIEGNNNDVLNNHLTDMNDIDIDLSLDKRNILPTETQEIENVSQEFVIDVQDVNVEHAHDLDGLLSKPIIEDQGSCLAGFHESDCPRDDGYLPTSKDTINTNVIDLYYLKLPLLAYEVFLVLIIAGVTIVVFLWGYIYIDRSRKEILLVAKINNLQKQFLILKKENEMLTEKISEVEHENMNKAEVASNEIVENLKTQLEEADSIRLSLEHQIQSLEKELENSTEVGLELNRMLSEFLNSDNGSDTLIANIDQLQRQLLEQQGTINTYNETINIKETENHELRLELDINNSRVNELQSELNKMALSLLKLEEDKEQLQHNYETDVASLKKQLETNSSKFKSEVSKISEELSLLKQKYEASQRSLELKTNEYKLLKENINHVNSDNNNSDILQSMFDTTSIKAELLQLRNENQLLNSRLHEETNRTSAFEKQAYLAMEDAQQLKAKYDTSDRERMEAQTKLEILSNYFKEREAQLQKELTKQESMWIEKQGEASSTIERIKYMQEELQNYKTQYESLKQEILAQEVDMKSQISLLEKKAHENWVTARQAERKLEDAKQEAAQLRNRLTLRERNLNDDKVQNRLVSPVEQNGDLSLNDTGTALPIMFGTREHLTTSPGLPSLPHFLPPPPGVPFMPPPLGGVPLPPPGFLPPPPPSMIPGDHRPPPLGRMSSPPLNSRYSPDSIAYSGYSRNSPSPTSDDDYDRPVYRSYSPYTRDDRRDFPRPPPPPINRNSVRNHRGTHSSGSAHSTESLEKINRHNSKV